jgi:hypothetical protein
MAQEVGRESVTLEARVRTLVSTCEMCGGISGTGTGFSPSYLCLLCQYFSTVAVHTRVSPWR